MTQPGPQRQPRQPRHWQLMKLSEVETQLTTCRFLALLLLLLFFLLSGGFFRFCWATRCPSIALCRWKQQWRILSHSLM